jgi:hypothetical protein
MVLAVLFLLSTILGCALGTLGAGGRTAAAGALILIFADMLIGTSKDASRALGGILLPVDAFHYAAAVANVFIASGIAGRALI